MITNVYVAGENDVDLAVKAAKSALKSRSWRDLSPTARGDLLNKLADLIDSHREILATIESWDNGGLIYPLLRRTVAL